MDIAALNGIAGFVLIALILSGLIERWNKWINSRNKKGRKAASRRAK